MCKKYSKTSGDALSLSGKEAAVYGAVMQHRTWEGTHLGLLLVAELPTQALYLSERM